MYFTKDKMLWNILGSILVSLVLVSCSSALLYGSMKLLYRTPAPTDSMKLNVGQLNNSINFFPFYVAEQLGYFKAQGLTLGARPRLQTDPKIISALENGSIDIGGGTITGAFDMTRLDWQARVIGALTNGYVVDIVVSKRFEQETHLTEASPLKEKVDALRGKKIAMTGPGSGTEALLIYLFRQQGMDVHKDATLVNLGSNEKAALAALRSNRVDALSFFSPIGQVVEAQGMGDIFISPDNGDVPALRGDVHGLFYTKESVIETKPKAVAAFIRAVAQAESYIQSHPTQAEVLLNNYLKLGKKVSNAVYAATSPVWAKNPSVSQSSYNVAARFHTQAGLISIAPTYNDLVATDTTNAALNS
jgi:NitT/TauT family transport system substrate-binding protein